jgi:hypothetical protein
MSAMDLDLTPSPRSHGAQRMITATVLVCEALVVFFAVLVAHQLAPGDRAVTWTWGLITAFALLACGGMLSRGAWAYWLALVLQLPVLLLGLRVGSMWVVGILFAVMLGYGIVKGRQLDAEKDAVDAQVQDAGIDVDGHDADGHGTD